MKPLSGVALAAAAITALTPLDARAQGPDARVLPRGMVELRVLGAYTQFGERFGADGRDPLGSGFDALIAAPATFLATSAADSVRTRLAGFYQRTQDETGGETPLDLEAGTARSKLSADFRDVAATVALGLSSRLTLEASSSLHRRGTVVRGLLLEGATLGINPDPDRNAGILLQVDSTYAATVGRYLPLRESAAGRELQRRVQQIAGDTLTLPTAAIPVAALLGDETLPAVDSIGEVMLGAGSERTPYFLGDTYVGARFQLARSIDGWSAPLDSAGSTGFRATLAGRVRLPTGSRSATLFPLQFPPEGGHWGVAGDAAADWFLSSRWWVSAAGSFEMTFPADVRRLAFSEALPFPDSTSVRTLRREPAPRFAAWVTPRYRLTREIAFAAQYAFQHVGEATLSGGEDPVLLGPIETTGAQTAHAVGLGMSYSTLAAYQRGTSPFPAEVSLLYRTVVAGSGHAPKAGRIELQGRLYARVFGGPRRPAAPAEETAPAAPPAPPPPQPVP